ncbi:Uu.00g002740.m01.CDS01 [Anthostomella pinea]|uniref:Uu.00g002740.m01.CDS01 n=1 Tax=Anthostomella pinea TaxID=933095 RepID=A0AAI8VJJ0_9PEZI|nr:Uu.00g002740.m01.CDS01 [Anthostomella pinea]
MSNRNLCTAATVSCLTAALFGYSVGFIGGEIVLPSFLLHFNLDDLPPQELATARSWAVTAWIVGALVGVPSAMPVYVNTLLESHQQRDLSAMPSTVADTIDTGRLLNGMGVGAGTLVSPIYISEISPAPQRGMLMSGYQVLVQLGALIGFWMAFIAQATLSDHGSLQWQIPVSLQLIAGAMLLLGTLVVPDSPRYLAAKEKYGAMEKALSWLRRLDPTDPQLVEERMEIEAAANLSNKLKEHSFFNELRKEDVRHRLTVGVGLMVAQNMVGLNALNYYAPVIFMSAGFTSVSSSLFLTGIFGVVKLVSSLAFMFKCVHVKGNRFWLELGTTVCAISMLVLGYCVSASPSPEEQHEGSITAVGIVGVLMVYVFSFFFGVSLGPISWNVCAEIFPLHINSTCCAITTCTQWAFQILIAAITPPLLATIGWATYVIYGGFCILSLVWIVFCVPETRGVGVGKPMDEIFGADMAPEEEAIVEASETTALLVHDRRRRSSLTAYT